ncbi:ADP-ribosyl cyclase/cyclic ADP-ribose hydrolase-like isoform X2 [Actinia tenebrosa]|uniref:ADP-ribosyl cyclase/cyclic ADP-ribose hydrolase-like isoform X2 n=1 Tax=Actinia tenebrosa TaxID=6105 RepID=A0A6P8IJW2_ACTTE|nr:ADP-ribosyl cyclase/cyclic ADP-ribose hydrolase-like isoform X2 [Actinia tenebrosa]
MYTRLDWPHYKKAAVCGSESMVSQDDSFSSIKNLIFHKLENQIERLSSSDPSSSDNEAFVRSKIQKYYYLRSGKQKMSWMYKPTKGTTRHLREIFLGRCWDFVENKNANLVEPENINCDVLLTSFLKAFSYKSPCEVKKEDYRDFFNHFREKQLIDKVLLWSGTREWTHAYSGLFNKYVTLEDTLPGYVLNGLSWCGSKSWPGIDYKSCPYECVKQKAFWGLAAAKLAKRARGVVYVMLNGTRQHLIDRQIFPAFMEDSYLAENQVPNLPVQSISEVKILVGHSLHHVSLERCNSLTIKQFQDRLVSRGLKASCYDNPYVFRHLLCLEQPVDPLCLFKTLVESDS